MKKIICLLLFIPSSTMIKAQQKNFDTTAIIIMDKMSDVIGDLSSCRYTVLSSQDHPKGEAGLETSYAKNEVYMVGPNKMLVNVQGDKGHRQYFYNGTTLSYYSYDENNYATIHAPATIVQTIDSVNQTYGVDFPAADFFYPGFTDDFLTNCDQISYLGTTWIDGQECFHILGKNKEMNIQIWVTNDAKFLPEKLLINYSGNKDLSRYEASFSEWQLNPNLPVSMFEFSPPPSARQVRLLSKNEK